MAVHGKRNLVMVMMAVGAVCAPAHVAWARQDLRAVVASDPGDGVLGDVGDGFGGDPNDWSDGGPNDGEEAHAVGVPGGDHQAGDPGDGDGASPVAGDPGDGDERFPRGDWRSVVMYWLVSIIAGASR